MFQHYIITRFNLRKVDWTTTKSNQKVLSDSWLEERFELFENYCFPSVKNQSNQDFKWLVFFDNNTPDKYKQKIEEYKMLFENFYPFFINGMDNYLTSINDNVVLLDDKKYIITSRLDNDDSLNENYCEVVQSYFDEQTYMAIDIIDGFTMQVGDKIRLGYKKHLYNPFISLIEAKKNFKSVWYRDHTAWKYENKIIRVENKRLWLSIIHENNKVNEFTGYGNVNFDSISDFGIPTRKITNLRSGIEKWNSWYFLNFKNRINTLFDFYYKEIKKGVGLYNK